METAPVKLSTNASRVKRGWFSDPECHRTTYRLRKTLAILHAMGIEPTFAEHAETCMKSPAQRGNRCHNWLYYCDCHVGNDPRPTWPEWATDEMFNMAASAASAAQTARGEWHQRQINERRAAARAAR